MNAKLLHFVTNQTGNVHPEERQLEVLQIRSTIVQLTTLNRMNVIFQTSHNPIIFSPKDISHPGGARICYKILYDQGRTEVAPIQ
jgi:hypothetical protein